MSLTTLCEQNEPTSVWYRTRSLFDLKWSSPRPSTSCFPHSWRDWLPRPSSTLSSKKLWHISFRDQESERYRPIVYSSRTIIIHWQSTLPRYQDGIVGEENFPTGDVIVPMHIGIAEKNKRKHGKRPRRHPKQLLGKLLRKRYKWISWKFLNNFLGNVFP